MIGLEIQQEADTPDALGLGHFEAIAMTLKAIVDKARPATRKDVVRCVDEIEETLPAEGEFPGVDRRGHRDARRHARGPVRRRGGGRSPLRRCRRAVCGARGDGGFPAASSWPAEVFAIDAAGADPAQRDARALDARAVMQVVLDARQEAVHAAVPLLEGQGAATRRAAGAERDRSHQAAARQGFSGSPTLRSRSVRRGVRRVARRSGRAHDQRPWRISGWLTQLARVREGANRFMSGLAAHEALVAVAASTTSRSCSSRTWTGRSGPRCQKRGWSRRAPPSIRTTRRRNCTTTSRSGRERVRNIHRVAPDLTVALHAPAGLAALAADQMIAGLVCDEWPEFVPSPYQTAAIGFHYDAPGARPPQSVLLAMPPRIDQDAWTFDDLMDVIHEAFDLAKLRTVRPRDLAGGLGALLPGNYLPQSYTDDLPSVQLLEMLRRARARLVSEVSAQAVFTLGKI